MAIINIEGVNTHYIKEGNSKNTMIALHGWGQNTQMMQMIVNHFKSEYTVYAIDFPGFGQSDLPPVSWGIPDYTNFLKNFIETNNVVNPILIGHSFGCRVAIDYAAQYDVNSMVLTGAAGIRPKRTIGWYYRTYTYKLMKNILKLPIISNYSDKIKGNFGSADYQATSGVMRETLVKVVNYDVSHLLSKIEVPVLLVFGENDEATPVWMGKQMEKEMKNAGLAIFENDDHYAYFHQWERFNRCIEIFLKAN